MLDYERLLNEMDFEARFKSFECRHSLKEKRKENSKHQSLRRVSAKFLLIWHREESKNEQTNKNKETDSGGKASVGQASMLRQWEHGVAINDTALKFTKQLL